MNYGGTWVPRSNSLRNWGIINKQGLLICQGFCMDTNTFLSQIKPMHIFIIVIISSFNLQLRAVVFILQPKVIYIYVYLITCFAIFCKKKKTLNKWMVYVRDSTMIDLMMKRGIMNCSTLLGMLQYLNSHAPIHLILFPFVVV